MTDKKAILTPDGTYHIYNRANGKEALFISDDNYRFFLEKYKHHIIPIADTFCYCLMPNHFHFLVRIKEENTLKTYFSKKAKSNLQDFRNLEGLLSQQFSNFFNAYAKAFNKEQFRKGNLFMHTYKRKKIHNEKYLKNLVHYIHYNPIEAGLAINLKSWKYSSYSALVSAKKTILLRNEVLEWFGDLNNFIYYHQNPVQ